MAVAGEEGVGQPLKRPRRQDWNGELIENGAFYSQFGIYKDKVAAKGGWPLALPNPNNTDEEAKKLWDFSLKAVGLKA